MTDEPNVDHAKRLLYSLFFAELNLDQAGFAEATRTRPSQVSDCLRGKRNVPDAALERAAEAVRFPRALLKPALRALRSYRAATRGWSRVDRVMTETFFAELLAWSGEALEAIFTAAAPPPPPRMVARPADPDLVAGLWLRLERRNPRQRVVMVEEIEEFQNPALGDLVAAKSRELGASDPEAARELAELAVRIERRAVPDR